MLWNELRKAVLKKQTISKHWNPEGMPLLTIIRTTKLVNSQFWHMNEIRQALEKTVLSRKSIIFILKQWEKKHGETIFEGSVANELELLFEDSKKKAKDAEMMIDSKIQTFKMYQTFGDRIPSFLYSRYLFLPNETWMYRMRSIKELLLHIFTIG
jgi:hypothetical protein